MFRNRTLVFGIILCTLLPVTGMSESESIQLEEFLISRDMNTSEFGYTLQDFQTVPNDPFTIPKVMTLLNDPFLIPEYTRSTGEFYIENHGRIGQLLRKCARDSGSYLWRSQPPLTEGDEESPYTLFGDNSSLWRESLREFLKNVPQDEKPLWIRFFASCERFNEARAEALRNIPSGKWDDIHAGAIPFLLSDDFDPVIYDACSEFDFDSLYRGALILTDSFDALRAGMKIGRTQNQLESGDYQTPIGIITVSGDEQNFHSSELHPDTFLLIETGGNDDYAGFSANDSPDTPLRILWDLDGNDDSRSKSDSLSGQGAGVLGLALHVDEEGNDTYEAGTFGQGAGVFGVGILFDAAGNDEYTGKEVVQGAGVFGIGILADIAGDDTYSCFYGGQGFAYVRGGGLLLDLLGDDRYIARDDEILYPSAQSKEHNVSMSQGAGYGRRADFSDGHFMSGGVAFLVDGGGDDYYSTGVFGQGVGYWFGGGFLYDAGGNDEYYGVWYSQAASAHFAPAGMIDVSGDDEYYTLISQCLGNGRDLSNAVFIDLDGDDTYRVPDRSAGCGNINGFGLFVDSAGNDTYDILKPTTLGRGDLAEVQGNLVREKLDSTGVFIDAGGMDEYVFPPDSDFGFTCEDDSMWGIATKPGEMSLGIDGEFTIELWPVKEG